MSSMHWSRSFLFHVFCCMVYNVSSDHLQCCWISTFWGIRVWASCYGFDLFLLLFFYWCLRDALHLCRLCSPLWSCSWFSLIIVLAGFVFLSNFCRFVVYCLVLIVSHLSAYLLSNSYWYYKLFYSGSFPKVTSTGGVDHCADSFIWFTDTNFVILGIGDFFVCM